MRAEAFWVTNWKREVGKDWEGIMGREAERVSPHTRFKTLLPSSLALREFHSPPIGSQGLWLGKGKGCAQKRAGVYKSEDGLSS